MRYLEESYTQVERQDVEGRAMGSAEVKVLCNVSIGCDLWCHLLRPTYCIQATDTHTHIDTDKARLRT